MKRLISTAICIAFIFCLTACGTTSDDRTGTPVPKSENYEEQAKNEATNSADTPDEELVAGETNTVSGEESEMKLFINDVEIPVIWEENDSVAELMEDASKGDVIISMSMYSDFEQVGSLGKKYHSDDKQMTVHTGRIEDGHVGLRRINSLTNGFGNINKFIEYKLQIIPKVLFKASDFGGIRDLCKTAEFTKRF